ncbi:MAG TPA: ABC transporter substrate-binding protein [Gemmatimonadales bacterium]
MDRRTGRCAAVGLALLGALGCGPEPTGGPTTVTVSGSVLGAEGLILRRQLERFDREHAEIRVEMRPTPDAADLRHQLYVQWLNARATDPDILQVDAIWTPEFAAAGWILPLDRYATDTADFFPVTISANRWQGELFAMPWFVDVGMLYWRTDLFQTAPTTWDALEREVHGVTADGSPRYGLVWQGARYEGLVTVFVEYLGGFGGRILDGGRVTVAEEPGVRALTRMRDQIHRLGVVPARVLTWHEEEPRFAFQNGEAAMMRNWPYAAGPMGDTAESRVAGKFAVAPMPAGPGGRPTAAFGGAQLAINGFSPEAGAAWLVIEYLTRPEQMLERAQVVGQFPTRMSVFDDPALADALAIPPAQARQIIEAAVPRPVTPVYTQLSEILQIQLHRALSRQAEPADALARAAGEMQELLDRVGLGRGDVAVR